MDPLKILLVAITVRRSILDRVMWLNGTFATVLTPKAAWSTILGLRFRRKGKGMFQVKLRTGGKKSCDCLRSSVMGRY